MAKEREKRDVVITLKLTEREHERYQAEAEKYSNGNVCAWIRFRCQLRGRRPPSRAGASPKCVHGLIASRVCGACNEIYQLEQDRQARLEEQNRQEEIIRERRHRAHALAAEAGGVKSWFASMSPAERDKWQDLESQLLKSEQLHRDAEESWARFTGQSPESYERTPPKPQAPPQALVPTGIIEIDYPPDALAPGSRLQGND